MPAAHLAITKSHRAMRVDLRRTVYQGEVANERDQLHLLQDGDVAVGFLRPIEPTEPRPLQGADGGEIARREFFAPGKFRYAGKDFVALGKNQGVGLFAAG